MFEDFTISKDSIPFTNTPFGLESYKNTLFIFYDYLIMKLMTLIKL